MIRSTQSVSSRGGIEMPCHYSHDRSCGELPRKPAPVPGSVQPLHGSADAPDPARLCHAGNHFQDRWMRVRVFVRIEMARFNARRANLGNLSQHFALDVSRANFAATDLRGEAPRGFRKQTVLTD